MTHDPMTDLLRRFRDFVVANPGANHHHPIWAEVADAIDRKLVWICSGCDGRVDADKLQCPACTSGVEEHMPGLFGADRDTGARARAIARGQRSYRQGPNHTRWHCVECERKLISQYEQCTCGRVTSDAMRELVRLRFLTVPADNRKCRMCGCTTDDYSQCITKTGKPCSWVEDDLCSACVSDDIISGLPSYNPDVAKALDLLTSMCTCPVSVDYEDSICTQCGGVVSR